MKTKNVFLGILMCSTVSLITSCLSESKDLEPKTVQETEQKGQLLLNLTADASFGTMSRALVEADYLNTDNYTVEIWNVDKEKMVYTCKANDFDAKVLDTDVTYEVRAYYGTEYPMSRDDFRMEGSAIFRFDNDGQTKSLNVECGPTCGRVAASFASEMDTYFSSYKVEFGGTEQLGDNTFLWNKTDVDPWYIALSKGTAGEEINYTITMKAKKDYVNVDDDGNKLADASVTGKFTLKRNKAYKLNVSPSYTPNTQGGLTVIVTIDDTTNDKPITIEVPVTWI